MESSCFYFPGMIIWGLIFFSGNLYTQFNSKKKPNIHTNYLKAFSLAVAGILLGFAFAFITDPIALYIGLYLSGITLLSMLSGLLNFLIKRDTFRLKNSSLILAGLFNSDTDESFLSNLRNTLSRFTWELPQTLLGYSFVQVMNCIGRVGEVRFIAGATFCLFYRHSRSRQGVSVGNFIYASMPSPENKFEKNPLLLHEFGHLFQSRRWGLLYLFVIGIPSLMSAIRAKPLPGGITTHDLQWYEMQANRYAALYLKKNYQADWTQFEPPINSFPRSKFRKIT